ncbi:MAG: hypothetical protein CHKLHMKO_00302 [Candidatus Argoarchaeum ethanivorans]|uniref:Uncharacterized protein n=1 Tax=Candidatus Argoarchaeum ethanivorans TaxID=2608793 RepID=A0A811T9V0_9EURY|nr:MAG: hypothetical protein CHKLHMKO_00302 [Candidatus Argoarchaeum ethanivorans]
METIHKIQTLEKLINIGTEDELVDKTLSKLIEYRTNKMNCELQELEDSMKKFESKYNMNPKTFCKKFEEGELGDEMDFFEWYALCDIHKRIVQRLNIAKRGIY